MIVAGYPQLGQSQLGQAQNADINALLAQADQLSKQAPTKTYDAWAEADAWNAVQALLFYYKSLAGSRTAIEQIDAQWGFPIAAGTRFSPCDAICSDAACLDLNAADSICSPARRLDLTNALGQYLAMWQADTKPAKIEAAIGPDRMLYYLALTHEPNDEIRGRAAKWAGEIPIYDVRPIVNQAGKYVSFTVEGLLTLALRNPPVNYSTMPSATSVLWALAALMQITDRETPMSIRNDVLNSMRRITGKEPYLIKSSEIPGPYTDTEKANIFQAAQAVKAQMLSLPDPPPIPPAVPDPWLPTNEDVPLPEPYPPIAKAVSTRHPRIIGASLGGLAVLLGVGMFAFQWRQRRRVQELAGSPSQLTKQAFRAAHHYLSESPSACNLDGYCIEASVLMHKYLTKRGVKAKLVRYEAPEVGGHWTVRTPEGEFDPTITWWRDRPKGTRKGQLYEVTERSPHAQWVRTRVNVKAAYGSVWHEDFEGAR